MSNSVYVNIYLLNLQNLYSAFQLSIVKPKQLVSPITTDEDSSLNPSEFEVITCTRRQARENARVQVAIDFGFASHWLRKWREFCQPIIERRKAKRKQTSITFESRRKADLRAICSVYLNQ